MKHTPATNVSILVSFSKWPKEQRTEAANITQNEQKKNQAEWITASEIENKINQLNLYSNLNFLCLFFGIQEPGANDFPPFRKFGFFICFEVFGAYRSV